MILAKTRGRFGNELFFLAALVAARRRGEKIVARGFEDIEAEFPNYRKILPFLHIISEQQWSRYHIDYFSEKLRAMRLASNLTLSRQKDSLIRSRALPRVAVLTFGYFQDERLIDETPVLALRRELASRNQSLIQELGLSLHGQSSVPHCFVHVRRCDYLDWPDKDFPAALPSSWYISKIEHIRRLHPETRFLVFSDDNSYCKTHFSDIDNLEILELGVSETFLAMSLCDSGIASASTLSWWAAKLAYGGSNGIFIAPKYWTSWPRGKWSESEALQFSSFLQWHTVLGD